jgi:hypothetical protein
VLGFLSVATATDRLLDILVSRIAWAMGESNRTVELLITTRVVGWIKPSQNVSGWAIRCQSRHTMPYLGCDP